MQNDADEYDHADVVVTDGFTGNVALKSSEGLAKLVINEVKRQSQKNFYTRLLAKIAFPLLKSIYNSVNPDQYNGASLIGLRGIVIKSHGNAQKDAFYYAIVQAMKEAKKYLAPYNMKFSLRLFFSIISDTIKNFHPRTSTFNDNPCRLIRQRILIYCSSNCYVKIVILTLCCCFLFDDEKRPSSLLCGAWNLGKDQIQIIVCINII